VIELGLVAGEASGDLLGAHLVTALKARVPDLAVSGIAGPCLVEAGVSAIYPSQKLAVNGYIEVLAHLPELMWIRSQIARRFLRERPRAFIGIDAPDFNIGLEEKLKRAGIPTLHFVSPSIWAWRGERIHRIKRAVSHMLVVFPFEAEIYRQAGVPVTYVGHPLADVIPLEPDPAAARRALGLSASAPLVALLPGSRMGEVKRLLAPMLGAARHIAQARPATQFLLPAASAAVREFIRTHAPQDLALHLLDGQSHVALEACDVALLASGTAALEAALYKKPMVITYRVPRLTAALVRRKTYLPYAGLPNILAGRFVVPELLQEEATPEALARAVLAWFDDSARQQEAALEFHHQHLQLRQGAAGRIANAVLPYLAGHA
jgi:lipid-A-disaccharide synthase